MAMTEIVNAAMIVIGDEILSGRTKDKNIGFIADYLTNIGVDLEEVRIVSDRQDAIVEAVNNVQSTVEDHKDRSHAEHTETRETLATIKQQLKEGDRRIGRISEKIDKHIEGHA